MPRPHKEDALRDICDSAEAAVRYISGVTFDQLQQNDILQDALIRRLEIIGEATKAPSQETANDELVGYCENDYTVTVIYYSPTLVSVLVHNDLQAGGAHPSQDEFGEAGVLDEVGAGGIADCKMQNFLIDIMCHCAHIIRCGAVAA